MPQDQVKEGGASVEPEPKQAAATEAAPKGPKRARRGVYPSTIRNRCQEPAHPSISHDDQILQLLRQLLLTWRSGTSV